MPTTTTTTTTPMPTIIKETVMIGNTTNGLFNVEYSSNGSSTIAYTEALSSPIMSIVYGDGTNKAYVSTQNNLYIYNVSSYVSGTEISRILTITNTDNNIIGIYRKSDNSLWSLQSYAGKVVKMDPSTLFTLKEFYGFDAPFKIRFSDYHDAYFVVGSHILWKIDEVANTVDAVYEINDYSIRDFDVSESGIICLLLGGSSQDILRILDKDTYEFVFNQFVNGNLRYCRYCNAGRFYVLSELSSGSSIYSANHYVFDSQSGNLTQVSSENASLITTTTTTLGVTTKAVQITSPIGGETIQVGKQYDVKWMSSKSISDFVKIELYKGTILYSTLTNKTENTGIYSWTVASDIEEGSDYKIKITWLSASSNPDNSDTNASTFSIALTTSATTTTTTTVMTEHAIGVDYASASDQILIVLASGLYLIFDLSTLSSYGLFNLGISGVSAMATRSIVINGFDKQKKVRIFVGSAPYLSDRWDSGIVETQLKSCYYGGGNNLSPGEKYYVHVQTYSEQSGWGETQIQQFVMPH